MFFNNLAILQANSSRPATMLSNMFGSSMASNSTVNTGTMIDSSQDAGGGGAVMQPVCPPQWCNPTAPEVHVTIVTSTPYTPNSEQCYLGINVVRGCSVVLSPQCIGKVYIIKDTSGQAFTSNITVSAPGTTIDGQPSYLLNTDYGSITLVFNGTEWSVV